MRLTPSLMTAVRPVRFGQSPASANEPEAQQNAVKAGSAEYADGITTYYMALNPAAGTGTVYVHTTRPDKEAVLRDAPQKFTLVNSPFRLSYKPYQGDPPADR